MSQRLLPIAVVAALLLLSVEAYAYNATLTLSENTTATYGYRISANILEKLAYSANSSLEATLTTNYGEAPSPSLTAGYMVSQCYIVDNATNTSQPCWPPEGGGGQQPVVEWWNTTWANTSTLTPPTVTFPGWAPPPPLELPKPGPPTSPTGVMLYAGLLAAYLGLAKRLGAADALLVFAVVLAAAASLLDSTALYTGAALALVAGVVLKNLQR